MLYFCIDKIHKISFHHKNINRNYASHFSKEIKRFLTCLANKRPHKSYIKLKTTILTHLRNILT